MMKHNCIVTLVYSLFLGLLFTPHVQAYDLPSVNLGFTSFMDGGPPAGPGFYYTQYIQYWTSHEFKNKDGDELLPHSADEDFDAWISLSQFIYQSDRELLLKGKWGLDVIVPYVGLDVDYDMDAPFPQDNGSGFGDILIGPFVQWDPIMGKNGPIFMHRIELQMILPTGKYDDDRELNPGSNFFSFNPYWTGTLFVTPKWTFTSRLHYLWNAENNDPNRNDVAGYNADDSQAGQAIHINFATAYEILPKKLRVGLNGYYLKQISDTEIDGNDISGRRERVFGFGPGALYHITRDNHLFFNAYFESQAENRPEGNRFNIRFVHHF